MTTRHQYSPLSPFPLPCCELFRVQKLHCVLRIGHADDAVASEMYAVAKQLEMLPISHRVIQGVKTTPGEWVTKAMIKIPHCWSRGGQQARRSTSFSSRDSISETLLDFFEGVISLVRVDVDCWADKSREDGK